MVTRARVGSSVLHTREKSARPSASLKGHRNFKFSCWNYMAICVFNTELPMRAREEFCIVHNRKPPCNPKN